MKPTRSFLRTVIFALLASAASATQAVPLQDLLGGGSLTAGDKLFDQWSIVSNSGFNTVGVSVDGLSDGGLDPGPGVAFSVNPSSPVTGTGVYTSLRLVLGFRVSSTDPGLSIKDASLGGFGGFLSSDPLNCTPTGNPLAPCNDLGIRIEESVFADAAATTLLGSTSLEFSYLDGTSTLVGTSGINFSPASIVYVRQDILLWAVNRDDQAGLLGFSARFSQTATRVPEPSSLLLFGVGLVALMSRKRRHAD